MSKKVVATFALLGFFAFVGCSGNSSTGLKSGSGGAHTEAPKGGGGKKDTSNTSKAPPAIQ